VTNLSNSKAYGYLLDGSNLKALQVDLPAFLATSPDSSGDGHQVSVDLTTNGVIIPRTW
jgi:hypothetical protein